MAAVPYSSSPPGCWDPAVFSRQERALLDFSWVLGVAWPPGLPWRRETPRRERQGGGGARERSSRRPQAGAGACRKREMPMETPSPVLAWGSVLPGQMPDARCQMVDVRGYLPTALCTLLSLVDCSTRLSPLRPTVTQHCRCVWPWRERRLSGHPHRAVSTASGSASHGQRRVHARRPPAVRSAPYTPAQPQTLGPPACWGASA